jgi:hypothetical protein
LSFRNVAQTRDEWLTAMQKPAAIVVDGIFYRMSPYQATAAQGGKAAVMVSFSGRMSIAAALAGAKSAAIEFGGKRYDLGDCGIANCRELLRRSKTAER